VRKLRDCRLGYGKASEDELPLLLQTRRHAAADRARS
jgi:hypothetical protein